MREQALMERYEKLLAGQWFSDFTTVKGIDARGETRWAEIREIPYSWQGRPAVMSLVHDITDRVRADEERREREERFRSIIENAWDGITILDENYNVIFESPSLARISGYTPEEWMGRPVGQMAIHPDDLVRGWQPDGDSQEPTGFSDPGCHGPVPAQGWFLALDRGHRPQPSPRSQSEGTCHQLPRYHRAQAH